MRDGQINQSLQINRIADRQWQMANMADFDGDGKADILWRNQSSGSTYMYLMNGNAIIGQGSSAVIGTDWRLIGAVVTSI
ncbi:VCBS repeat-containing protein [Litorilituus lipolyticus]|uniref:VCBS repeat-containing protein n=2 Tax=Litorilituus lipolyticus TaxID=2491017 RepID=A0A502L614_9GAMM|nr:VCBS repeat-containing protein [Litorilituus lipolyticus]